jgi:broad specificity phosphatase PhoE
MAASELLLLRHAESTWNALGLWQGHGDPPLSDAGRRMAADCEPRVRSLAPQVALASDLQRAIETARIAAPHLELHVDPRWREWDVGCWSGLPHARIRERWPELYRALGEGALDVAPPGGETRRSFAARVRAAVAEAAAQHAGRRLLVVTHRGVILSLLPGCNPGHLAIHSLVVGGDSPLQREQGPQDPADG